MTQDRHEKIRLHTEKLDKARRRLAETEVCVKRIEEHIAYGRTMVSVTCSLDGANQRAAHCQFQVAINLGLIHAQMRNKMKQLEDDVARLLPAGVI